MCSSRSTHQHIAPVTTVQCQKLHSLCTLLLGVSVFFLASMSEAAAQNSKSKITSPQTAVNSGTDAATPSGGSKTTFTVTVDQNYCDVSLPYSYSSTEKTLTLNMGSRSPSNWHLVLKQEWPAIGGKIQFDDLNHWTTGDRDSPPVVDGKAVELNDNGAALLSDPAHELSSNTFDAQRLLIRTLFSPNPFQVACAYPYIKYPNPGIEVDNAGKATYFVPASDGSKTSIDLHSGPDGKSLNLLGQGVVNQFSLNGETSPQYYLIDIVRWKDAAAPNGAPSTVPFFQPVSDDWYLLNYSDSKARPQDISSWFHRITPSLASDTLRIIGSSQVMFLAIHLAPAATDATGKPMVVPVSTDASGNPLTTAGAPNMTATEKAWYDDVTIKYSIQATAYEPTQMQDLNDLIQILGTYLPGNLGAAAAPAVGAPGPGLAAAPPPPPSPLPANPLIDNFLHENGDLAKPLIVSTYQGRYAAGLLTNLTALPVNLTNTWTATFSSTTPSLKSSVPYGIASTTPPTPPCAVSLNTSANDKTTPKQADCLVAGAKVQNEGLSHWDVSVIVPASSYSDVTFQASMTTGGTNTVTTSKTVSRTNAYGVFDIFLYPEDLVHPPNVGIPHLIVGLPFAGKVFDKPYFAVGETLNLPNTLGKLKIFNWIPGVSSLVSKDLPLSLRPTFGWVFNKVFPTPGSSVSYRSLKPQFGVEISITGLVKTLSKSSGNSTGTTPATKNSTGSTVPQT